MRNFTFYICLSALPLCGVLRLQAGIHISNKANYPQDGCAVRHSVSYTSTA
jgi:hypothetical protein